MQFRNFLLLSFLSLTLIACGASKGSGAAPNTNDSNNPPSENQTGSTADYAPSVAIPYILLERIKSVSPIGNGNINTSSIGSRTTYRFISRNTIKGAGSQGDYPTTSWSYSKTGPNTATAILRYSDGTETHKLIFTNETSGTFTNSSVLNSGNGAKFTGTFNFLLDTDKDGTSDATDNDIDGDGVVNFGDAFPLDPTETQDSDGDGIGNNKDTDDDNDGIPDELDSVNGYETDSDGDGLKDYIDEDDDGDGINDIDDAFPLNRSESVDTDGDGVGDNADAFDNDASETTDTDNDGVGDNADLWPEDAARAYDRDGDGISDSQDLFPDDSLDYKDTDGDGIGDNADDFPLDSSESKDSDGDGTGDNADAYPNDESRSLFSVSVTVSGLSTYLKLTYAEGFLNVSGNGVFQLAVAKGTSITMVLDSYPESQNCSIEAGTHTINSDINVASVQCTDRVTVEHVATLVTDSNFASCLTTQLGNSAYAENVETIICNSSPAIITVDGLENFQNLKRFSARSNTITSIDVSSNSKLVSLDLTDNEIDNLDLTANSELTTLDLGQNQLNEINLVRNTLIKSLELQENQLTQLDLSFNALLDRLILNGNQFSNIDLSANTALTELSINTNLLEGINLSTNTNLTSLEIQSNQLISLDLSNNVALELLILSYNPINNIDLSSNIKLNRLWLNHTQITNINLSNNIELDEVLLAHNNFSSIDVTANTLITTLNLYNNNFVNVPEGLSSIADKNARIILQFNNFDINATAELDVLKQTYTNLSY